MPKIENSILQEIHFSDIKQKGISLFIKREDLIHPYISGNKFRKLKYNILQAQEEGHKTLLTFGGAFSNHIAAVASVGKEYSFKTIGVIRGDELQKDFEKILISNPTLKFANECGMQFKFVSRTDYRLKNSDSFINNLKNEFGDFYLIPEGGTNKLAVKGCEEILDNSTEKFNVVCCSIGTGGTISGLINSVKEDQKVIGFPALKGNFLEDEIKKLTSQSNNWKLINDYHFGGYAKTTEELISFINRFKKETKIQLDPIYTGKMVFGIIDLIKKNYFNSGTKILVIHTGGLQAIEGMNTILKKKNSLIIE
ncbi:1-aminocyclopropane-1-carboxylate deaminase/D-cysteine desulfhydrase [Urechidicola croceus]|uniref:1-aminocyclopropane-1-carboxylate deaminase n=1 Tax=Urechidicola croceus TaxID=1850246 RepID=A0A1D8PAV1_9FLAO|nr:pyridoxal-phosphate dependent enzyme [Urechidicola croceus]AOW21685.1 1-aminocyclopropane-1-carboxylate deaminase [Urechidicola croceus]